MTQTTYYFEVYGITKETYAELVKTIKQIDPDIEYEGGIEQ